MQDKALQQRIEHLFDNPPASYSVPDRDTFIAFRGGLDSGHIRAAEPDPSTSTGWRPNPWVKKGILLGFRMGALTDMSVAGGLWPFFDKDTYPLKSMTLSSGVRIVPGGSSIREGAYVAPGVTCMPPMYINVGAYVDAGSMIDSHALVGSCAQVGKNCHVSAAAQLGGVLEPIGAIPVILEDDVMVGGNCGVYEGTVVKKRVVLGTGVILNRSTPIYDLVKGEVYSASGDDPLIVPENAVVVAGSRAVSRGKGQEWGISLYTPIIVKYRDERTDAKVKLEDYLR